MARHQHRDPATGRYTKDSRGGTAPTPAPAPVTPITAAPSSAGVYTAAWRAYQDAVRPPVTDQAADAGEWVHAAAHPDYETTAVAVGDWLLGRAPAPEPVERHEMRDWLADWMTSDDDLYAREATAVWHELDALDVRDQMPGLDSNAARVAAALDRPHPMEQARTLLNDRCADAEARDDWDNTGGDAA